MNREQKAAVVEELQDRFSRASLTLLATNRGLTVAQASALRRRVRSAGGEYKVAKLTLTRRAIETTTYRGLDPLLQGPRALVFGYDDPVAVAKAVVDFAKDNDKLEIGGGAVEGQPLTAAQVEALAKMPALPELRARIAAQILAPATRLSGSIAGPARRLAGCLKTLADTEERGDA